MRERWVCSVPGSVAQMRVADFWELLNSSTLFGRMLLCYEQSVISALAVAVTCNAKHSLLQRCAKWLLLSHDRVRSDTFEMTHELLATLLGVRRSGVSTVASALQNAGSIRYSRGRITITDRAPLERATCQCYAIITAEYDCLMERSRSEPPGPAPYAARMSM
jgi:CRP-like cAMP-binding protein